MYRDGITLHSQISKEMKIFCQKSIEYWKLNTPTLKSNYVNKQTKIRPVDSLCHDPTGLKGKLYVLESSFGSQHPDTWKYQTLNNNNPSETPTEEEPYMLPWVEENENI